MRVGNLVKFNRLSIGIPPNAIGLVVKEYPRDYNPYEAGVPYSLWEVTIYGTTYKMRNRRFLARDLEVINE